MPYKDKEQAKAANRESYHKYGQERRTYSKRYYADHKKEKSEYGESYYSRNRERILARIRKTYFERRYGITQEYYDNLWELQNGLCAICFDILVRGEGRGRNGGNVHLDHDHENGLVRGLLCSKCNLGLGYFLDEPRILRSAERYLHHYGY